MKTISILLLIPIIIISCKDKTKKELPLVEVEIKGVITYFFNNNYGDKPDVGAEVYIVESSKVPDFNLATVDSFIHGSFIRNIYLSYKLDRLKVPNDVMEGVNKYNVKDTANYYALMSRSTRNWVKIYASPNNKEAVVDGNGNYSVKVNPGSYYMLIKSKHRSPSLYCKEIHIVKGEVENVSKNFNLY